MILHGHPERVSNFPDVTQLLSLDLKLESGVHFLMALLCCLIVTWDLRIQKVWFARVI